MLWRSVDANVINGKSALRPIEMGGTSRATRNSVYCGSKFTIPEYTPVGAPIITIWFGPMM